MLSRERQYLEYAAKCDEFARRIQGRPLQALFRHLGNQWRELARLNRDIEADAKQVTAFFKGSAALDGGAVSKTADLSGSRHTTDVPGA
jgi:hypothetical protein